MLQQNQIMWPAKLKDLLATWPRKSFPCSPGACFKGKPMALIILILLLVTGKIGFGTGGPQEENEAEVGTGWWAVSVGAGLQLDWQGSSHTWELPWAAVPHLPPGPFFLLRNLSLSGNEKLGLLRHHSSHLSGEKPSPLGSLPVNRCLTQPISYSISCSNASFEAACYFSS